MRKSSSPPAMRSKRSHDAHPMALACHHRPVDARGWLRRLREYRVAPTRPDRFVVPFSLPRDIICTALASEKHDRGAHARHRAQSCVGCNCSCDYVVCRSVVARMGTCYADRRHHCGSSSAINCSKPTRGNIVKCITPAQALGSTSRGCRPDALSRDIRERRDQTRKLRHIGAANVLSEHRLRGSCSEFLAFGRERRR